MEILTVTPASPWMTATEAANYLRIDSRTMTLWARRGDVKGHVLSGSKRATWRFLRADLDAMLTGPAVLSQTKGEGSDEKRATAPNRKYRVRQTTRNLELLAVG